MRSTSGACVAESDPLHSFRSLHAAYVACRSRKRSAINTLRFEASLLDNLSDLSTSLADGTYSPSRSVCFVAKQPKHREVFAADFRDRVIHHALVPRIEKIFEPKFIHDSHACRRGKGTHAAVERLRAFMIRVTRGGRIPAWFMQLDIRSFFMSIDREILLGILARHAREPRVLSLAETIVRQTLASYLGHFKHADSWRLVQGVFERYRWLTAVFRVEDGRLVPLYEPGHEPAGLRAQYRWALRRHGGACIFFQVGCFCEFYGEQAERYGGFYGLKLRNGARTTRSAHVAAGAQPVPSETAASPASVPGRDVQTGFPIRYLKGFKKKATRSGIPYVVLGEDGCYPSGLKRRLVTEIFTVNPWGACDPPAQTAAGLAAPPAGP